MIITPRVRHLTLLPLVAVVLGQLACAPTDDGVVNRNGGVTAMGGATGTGGMGATDATTDGAGGTTGAGGSSGSGGATGNGGTAAVGGMPAGSGGVAVDVAPEAADTNGPDLAPGGPFALTSTAFKEGDVIATKYRCRTENLSPPLAWTPGPAGTKSYAMIMVANGSSLHWVMWDIPGSVLSLPEGVKREAMPPEPAGAKQSPVTVDGANWPGYSGPCPQSPNRTYEYFVYALPVQTLTGITTSSNITQAATAVRNATPASARASITVKASP